jgi:hypothetical protein
MGLIIRSSEIHAAGCYTTSPIPTGARVLEYTGSRISKKEGDRKYDSRGVTYLFGLEDGTVIDGYGMAMYVNHSCDPNCETEETGGRIWITAIRDIPVGEELTYDYFLWDGDEEAPCNCGSANCRGSMYAPEEIKKRERHRAAAQKRATGRSNGTKRKRALSPAKKEEPAA